MRSSYKWRRPIFIFFLVIIIVWYFTHTYPPKITLSPKEEKHVKELLNKMETHCVGRYLIDLPASFTLLNGTEPLEENKWIADIGSPEYSHKIHIASKRMYYPAFEKLLKRREMELSEIRTNNPENMPFLKKIWPLPIGMKGVIFERNLDFSVNDMVRMLEGYIYNGSVAIKIEKKTMNDLAPRYKEYRERLGSETNNIPGDIEKFNDLLSRIQGREGNEIPRMTGSCMANIFLMPDKKGMEQEDISFVFSSEKIPGVNFVINTDNFTQEKSGLLDRTGEIRQVLSETDAEIFRKGRRKINGVKAEEMLVTGSEPDSDYPVYIFNLFMNETHGSNQTPYLNVALTNEGNSVIPFTGYNQNELIDIWNAITQTIRIRPVAI